MYKNMYVCMFCISVSESVSVYVCKQNHGQHQHQSYAAKLLSFTIFPVSVQQTYKQCKRMTEPSLLLDCPDGFQHTAEWR